MIVGLSEPLCTPDLDVIDSPTLPVFTPRIPVVLEEGAEAQAPAGGSLSAVAEQAEGLVFAHRKGADEKYLSYVRGLCSAVKGNHHELRDRLLRGEVAPALADFLNKV